MPTGMGVASPKFSKSNRKPKRTKHCTIPNLRKRKTRELKNKGICLNQVYMKVKLHKKNSKGGNRLRLRRIRKGQRIKRMKV